MGGAGNDLFVGGAGNDTFIFADGDGAGSIQDFIAGAGTDDVINVSAFGFSAFDDGTLNDVESALTQVGANGRLQLDADDVLILTGVDITDLRADDFIV